MNDELKRALVEFLDEKFTALVKQQSALTALLDVKNQQNNAVLQIVTFQQAQFAAMRSMLVCMIWAHPAPAELLERYLVEMDAFSDRNPKATESERSAFAEYVQVLTARTKPPG